MARLTAMALILAVSVRKTRPSSGKPQVAKTEAALHRRKECHSGQPCHSDTIAVSLATWERGRTSVRGKPRYPHGSTEPRIRHYLSMLGVVGKRQNARGRSLRTVWALSNPPPPPVFAALLYVNNTAVTVRKGGYRPELKPARGNEREKGLRAFRRPFDIHGGRRGT